MDGNIIMKPLWLVLIFAAFIVVIECNKVEVQGFLGTSITLEFTFNISITNDSHFAVYVGVGSETHRKIAEYKNCKSLSDGNFDVYPKNSSAFCCIRNLTFNDSGKYWASLFVPNRNVKRLVMTESKKVQLIVQENNRSSPAPPVQNDTLKPGDSGSSFHINPAFLTVFPLLLLLAAALSCVIWWLSRTKEKQESSPHQSSNPTIQETVPAPPLVYSVLEFPKRSSTVLDMNSSDTDYAAVRYLP